MARPRIGTAEEATARRRAKTAERVRRLRERRRQAEAIQTAPEPAAPAEPAPPPPAARDIGIAGLRLRSFVERIERLEGELRANPKWRAEWKAEHRAEIASIYAEAKGTGFDAAVLREAIRLRRVLTEDQQLVLDLYREALS